MKLGILILSLVSISAFADKMYYFTVRKDGIVCSIDVHVRDNGTIKTITNCFTK